MQTTLTVGEACDFTGKSESTIKRLIRDVTSQPSHPDRTFISPSAAELKKKQAAGEPYRWKVAPELLEKHYPPEAPAAAPKKPANDVGESTLTDVLKGQLDSKDQQIRTLETQLDRKDEQIAALNERMRESNVLMKELQQKVAIAAPSSAAAAATIDVTGPMPEKGTASTNEGADAKQSIWMRPLKLPSWRR